MDGRVSLEPRMAGRDRRMTERCVTQVLLIRGSKPWKEWQEEGD